MHRLKLKIIVGAADKVWLHREIANLKDVRL